MTTVETKKVEEVTTFGCLRPGDVFLHDNTYFMVISLPIGGKGAITLKGVSNLFSLCTFSDNERVYPCDSELTIYRLTCEFNKKEMGLA